LKRKNKEYKGVLLGIMQDKYYSVEELAHILDLHPKTVRRFIREGKIKAQKFGRAWKIHQDNFRQYAHAELKDNRSDSKIEYSSPDERNRITVSAVIEIREKDSEEASRISNSLIALLNSKDPSWGNARYDLIYHPEIGKARFVLYGTPAFIAAIMRMFMVISEQD
jgi:excisionase family DNA binding protein